jgi:NAD(P)-dependent dehydrogenase (short-subunit alcohol dehydrogenase family)
MITYNKADANFYLKGKTAIVIGGVSGIGAAAVEFFPTKDVCVAIIDKKAAMAVFGNDTMSIRAENNHYIGLTVPFPYFHFIIFYLFA